MQRKSSTLSVFPAAALRVVNGANLGDALSWADDLEPSDIYRLSPVSMLKSLTVRTAATPPFHIMEQSELGTPGHAVHLDCCVTFMSGSGETTECLVLVETDPDGNAAQVYALPLAEMTPKADYVLVGISEDSALQRYAQSACTSFTAGTMITLSTGAQKPVEDLRPGDRVLTRDNGPQALRWIGHHTARATGTFAPIRIAAGTLNNSRDLLVSPDHRLFIYQRRDEIGAGRSELLVRARHLVNGTTVTAAPGGFVDYYQMLFDAHQIIYAEGIAAESMLVNTQTQAALPADLSDRLAALIPGHRRSDISDLEIGETLLSRPDAAALLRKSSGG
ncbi:Hint domain-containing protein [Sagittula salina]|uniref:Hint domain-containing protein n=1 Tax=Sagittula salina TaxID=2820268 RepID=A0A940MLJ1_9RHOB|nr:Hint domain-containing protein [Sagittula salina]MBP0480922.1 Hint domain-containing protein [Sagittula salina]